MSTLDIYHIKFLPALIRFVNLAIKHTKTFLDVEEYVRSQIIGVALKKMARGRNMFLVQLVQVLSGLDAQKPILFQVPRPTMLSHMQLYQSPICVLKALGPLT